MIRPVGIIPVAVVRKDLRLRMRGWRWAGVVTLYIGILATIALAFLLRQYSPSPGQSSLAGIDFFQDLSIFQLFLIVFVTPAVLGGAISGERQHRTWDLLVASCLSTREIVWGKLLGGIAFTLMLIAASLPLFGLVFLFGGLSPAGMIPAFVVFLVTALLLGATSLAVSALTSRLTVSFMISLLIALVLTVGLSLLTLALVAPGQLGAPALAGFPFQSLNTPAVLTPLAQFDPLIALLSALPSQSGGSLLGGLGTVDHAFGLPWRLSLWGAYALVMGSVSLVLVLVTIRLVRGARQPRARAGRLIAPHPGGSR